MSSSPPSPFGPAPSSRLGTGVDLVGLVLLVVAAAVVRLSTLAEWWLNPDEGIYYSILTRSDFGGFWQEVTANAHPPLYYLILRGLGVFTWDFYWLRVFSVFCGLAAVAGSWAVARRLAGPGLRGSAAGLLAALLLAFAPGAVELSQVMRPYMLQLALLSWALFFFLRHGASGETRDLVGYLALLVLALLTHYSSVLALGVFLLTVAVRGMERGTTDPAWRRLAAAQVLPLGVVAFLYLFHLRPLAASPLADDALDGWLSFYMIRGPSDAWWSFLGFQHLVAGPWLRGPMAVLLLAALGAAVARRRTVLLALLGGALLVAVAVAAAGLYPFGSTRHSVWLLAFTVPALGWLGGQVLFAPAPRARIVLGGGVALLLLAGGPVGAALGADRAPWAPTDRVLRQDDLATVVDVLDPTADPGLVVMSAQTFYLLTPFYPTEREAASFATDSTIFHFPYGARQILVSQAWEFTLLEPATAGPTASPAYPRGGEGPAPPVQASAAMATRDDFVAFLVSADSVFPALDLEHRHGAQVLVGGWRPPFVDRLAARPEARSGPGVPGLYTFFVDVAEVLGTPD